MNPLGVFNHKVQNIYIYSNEKAEFKLNSAFSKLGYYSLFKT
ncbi:hypothetical protein GGR31_001031 [Mesonia maritima]|uniref:Uncharacterized protein n=1 Tax=Mesonia maritima TaxID=1793873 RepID=A0ABU1K568_9FLAO|nr:hypothetical protein [Mesonia maritima]